MSNRSTRPLVIISAFAVSLAIGLLAIFWLTAGLPGKPSPSAVGGPFQLVDQDGKTVTEKSMLGKPTLVFFGFTHCPDICPTSLFEMSETLRALGKDGDKVNAYFVSVDPERDTVPVMKSYIGSFDPRLKGLTGDEAAVKTIVTAYRAYAKKTPLKDGDYTMDHTALIYLMNKDGQFVSPFNIKRSPEDNAADLRRYF